MVPYTLSARVRSQCTYMFFFLSVTFFGLSFIIILQTTSAPHCRLLSFLQPRQFLLVGCLYA